MRRRFQRRGANAIEMALLLPVFVLLFTGTIDYAVYFWQAASVVSATWEGCRAGANTNPNEIPDSATVAQAEIEARLGSRGWASGEMSVSTTVDALSGDDRLQCDVKATNRIAIGLAPVPSVLTSSARLRLEVQL